MKSIQNKHLKTLFAVLFLGGLWGLLEATLGSLIHLPFIADTCGIWLSSTAVMVPIAYLLMSVCYTRVKNIRSVAYIGIVACSIKAIVCTLFGLAFNPVLYIALESLAGVGAIAAIRPTKVGSVKNVLSMAFGIASYAVAFIAIKGGIEVNAMKYLIAILYECALVGATYGVSKINIKKVNFEKILYSPIAASLAIVLAVTSAIILR